MGPAPGRRLNYVADPMCSWCWGFAPVLEAVRGRLADGVELRYVMGGLAEDSDEPMPEATRRYVQSAWDAVEARTGARFDRRFWERCTPRRSTYPACRAVRAAGILDAAHVAPMFAAVQRAYYLEARNPSDTEVLVAVAVEALGVDAERFAALLGSPEVEEALRADLAEARRLRVTGFPTLMAEDRSSGELRPLASGWEPEETVLAALADAGLARTD